MSPITIGTMVEIVDELAPVVAPTATDPCFLLHSAVDETTTVISKTEAGEAFVGEPTLLAMTDAYFEEGGAKLTVVPFGGGSGSGESLTDTLADFMPKDLGPGQIVAPEITDPADMAELAEWAWTTNRVYIADGPDGATDEDLEDLATAMRASDGARGAMVAADTLLIPGLASPTLREVPASIVFAALMARSDLATGNPNLAAAGVNGQVRYVVGISAERTETQRNALADFGINCFRTLYTSLIRAYGFRTVADLDDFPTWWDFSGSRTIMAVRALEEAVAEAHNFGQIDREGAFLASYEAGLARELKGLQAVGALYGTTTQPGYTVTAGWSVNPASQIAQGIVRARITLKTSTFAEQIVVSIIRRPVSAEV